MSYNKWLPEDSEKCHCCLWEARTSQLQQTTLG